MTDTLLLPVANSLLQCLCDALDDVASPEYPAPGICCIRSGANVIIDLDQTYDECCQGLAYVRIAGVYATGSPNAPFPSPSSDFGLSKCAPFAWALQLEMGVFRCVSSEQIPCTIAEGGDNSWEYITARQMNDIKAMRQALCCFMAPRYGGDVSAGVINPSAREGGCLGVTWQLSVQVVNCEGC